MAIVNIEKVSKVKKRPYVLNLNGYVRNIKFIAELQGSCLEIFSVTPLTEKQKNKLEVQLQEIFPVPQDGFKKKQINEIMKKSNGLIQIKL